MGEVNNAVETEEKRVPYTVEIDETVPFKTDAEIKILTSNELCKLANELFRAIFADYEGCYFEMSKNGPATITAVFNHGKHEEGRHYAVDMASSSKDAGNDVIQRARAFDRLAKEGDRYHITEDGKDIFKKFLSPRFVERNGKVNWGLIVSDYVERTNAFYGTAQQYTKIEGIDPRQLCFAIFGKEENGERLDYAVDVRGSVSSYNTYGLVSPNYALHIVRAHEEHLKETYEKLGFGAAGSGIIR